MGNYKLYLDNGFLNIPALAEGPSWLIVIIGARQVGKTYGTLKYMIDNNINHILLRRTTEELELIGGNADLNPYKAFEPEHHIGIFKSGKMYSINEYSDEGKGQQRGLALSLAQISHIRGFNGSAFTDIVYDEFIPEKGVSVRRSEGDSLLNAYTTINGNRELKGDKPARLWLLANSNSINSPILEALNLTDIVLSMRRKGEEIREAEGVLIVQPKSSGVLEKRKETALIKHLKGSGDFYKMAVENEFSYDYSPLVKTFPIKGMTPLFSYAGTFYAWEGGDKIYICKAQHKRKPYSDSQHDRERLATDWAILKRFYFEDFVYFSDLRMLSLFKQIFSIE